MGRPKGAASDCTGNKYPDWTQQHSLTGWGECSSEFATEFSGLELSRIQRRRWWGEIHSSNTQSGQSETRGPTLPSHMALPPSSCSSKSTFFLLQPQVYNPLSRDKSGNRVYRATCPSHLDPEWGTRAEINRKARTLSSTGFEGNSTMELGRYSGS